MTGTVKNDTVFVVTENQMRMWQNWDSSISSMGDQARKSGKPEFVINWMNILQSELKMAEDFMSKDSKRSKLLLNIWTGKD